MSGDHPLRSILRGYIGEVSQRRWGLADLSWVVTSSGWMKMEGSGTWNNICKGWQGLKVHIMPRKPVNMAEWRELPLWRPHVNHHSSRQVKCSTRPQQTLRNCGIRRMGDVMQLDSTICPWASMEARGIPTYCQAAYLTLVANLIQPPALNNSCTHQEFYVESVNLVGHQKVWKFMLTTEHCTERWLPFLDRSSPTHAYVCNGQSLRPIALAAPGPEVILRRIVVYSGGQHKLSINGGPWVEDNLLLTQYHWRGGIPLTASTTRVMRRVQNQQQAGVHPAIRKWESQLDMRLPEHIWHNMWLPFRSAKENMFLWQIVFRAIATLSWVFPNRPDTDRSTWCPRCPLGVKETTLHCLWQCPSSQVCWSWIGWLLARAAGYSQGVQLTAGQIILAASFPATIEVPFRLWQILRASLCWQLWLSRNDCVFSQIPFDTEAVCRRTWHKLSAYLRIEWRAQVANIRSGRVSRDEARARMAFFFGIEGVIWNLEDLKLQVPPCPPRPP